MAQRVGSMLVLDMEGRASRFPFEGKKGHLGRGIRSVDVDRGNMPGFENHQG